MFYSNKPMVSVHMITYNHENFIAKAIEGVLMQNTSFMVELVIGEDFSTDNTRQICIEYAKKNPQIIKLLPSNKNLGMATNGAQTLKACKGKYSAFCEGDDYWTDPNKLQKQVDFLEKNLGYVLSCHNYQILNNGKLKDRISNIKQTETILDLAKRVLFQSATVVYRSQHNEEICKNLLLNDGLFRGSNFIFMLLANYGKVYYFNENLSVYRIHSGGAWSGKTNSDAMSNLELGSLEAQIIHFSKNKTIKSILKRRYIRASLILAGYSLLRNKSRFKGHLKDSFRFGFNPLHLTFCFEIFLTGIKRLYIITKI